MDDLDLRFWKRINWTPMQDKLAEYGIAQPGEQVKNPDDMGQIRNSEHCRPSIAVRPWGVVTSETVDAVAIL